MTSSPSAAARREQLKEVFREASTCTLCPLAETRQTVVFGAGNADADLMFVGEAPGANEDKTGLPFVGQAGRLLDRLLQEIGLARESVFIANVLKCRPPGNRDPRPTEIEACRDWLHQQVDLIQPLVICTLGNFSTKLLRDDPTGISRIHGQPEVRVIGPRAVRIYPLYHPAAALYSPNMVDVLRADFARLPDLLSQPAPPQPEPLEEVPLPAESPDREPESALAPGVEAEADEVAEAAAGDSSAEAAVEVAEDGAQEAERVPDDQLGLF